MKDRKRKPRQNIQKTSKESMKSRGEEARPRKPDRFLKKLKQEKKKHNV